MHGGSSGVSCGDSCSALDADPTRYSQGQARPRTAGKCARRATSALHPPSKPGGPPVRSANINDDGGTVSGGIYLRPHEHSVEAPLRQEPSAALPKFSLLGTDPHAQRSSCRFKGLRRGVSADLLSMPASWSPHLPRTSADHTSTHCPPACCGLGASLHRSTSCPCLASHVAERQLTHDLDTSQMRLPYACPSRLRMNPPPAAGAGTAGVTHRPQRLVSGMSADAPNVLHSPSPSCCIHGHAPDGFPNKVHSTPSLAAHCVAPEGAYVSQQGPMQANVYSIQSRVAPKDQPIGVLSVVDSRDSIGSTKRPALFCTGCASASRTSMPEADAPANYAIPNARTPPNADSSLDFQLKPQSICSPADETHGRIPSGARVHGLLPPSVSHEVSGSQPNNWSTQEQHESYNSLEASNNLRHVSDRSQYSYNFESCRQQSSYPVSSSASLRSFSEPAQSISHRHHRFGSVATPSGHPGPPRPFLRESGRQFDQRFPTRCLPMAPRCLETDSRFHPLASSEGPSHAVSSLQHPQHTSTDEAVGTQSSLFLGPPRPSELLHSSSHSNGDQTFSLSQETRTALSPRRLQCVANSPFRGSGPLATQSRTGDRTVSDTTGTQTAEGVAGDGYVPSCAFPQSPRRGNCFGNSRESDLRESGTPRLSPASGRNPHECVTATAGGHHDRMVPISLTSFAAPGAAWVTEVRRQHASASGASHVSKKSRGGVAHAEKTLIPSPFLGPPYSSVAHHPPGGTGRSPEEIGSFGMGEPCSSVILERPSSPISFGVDRSPPCTILRNRSPSCSTDLRHPGVEGSSGATRPTTEGSCQPLNMPGAEESFSNPKSSHKSFDGDDVDSQTEMFLNSRDTAGTIQKVPSHLHTTSAHTSPITTVPLIEGSASSPVRRARSQSMEPTRGPAVDRGRIAATPRSERMRCMSPQRPMTPLRLPSPVFACTRNAHNAQDPRAITRRASGERLSVAGCTPTQTQESLWAAQDDTRRSRTQTRNRSLSTSSRHATGPLIGRLTTIPSNVTSDAPAPALQTERAKAQLNSSEQSGLLTTWEEAHRPLSPRTSTPQPRPLDIVNQSPRPSSRGWQGRSPTLEIVHTGGAGGANEKNTLTSSSCESSAAQTLSAGSFASLAAAAAATSADAAAEWGGVSSAPQGSTCLLSSIWSHDSGQTGYIDDAADQQPTDGRSRSGINAGGALTTDTSISRAIGSEPPCCLGEPRPRATGEAVEIQGTADKSFFSTSPSRPVSSGECAALSFEDTGRSSLPPTPAQHTGNANSTLAIDGDEMPSHTAFSVNEASTIGNTSHRSQGNGSPAAGSRRSVSLTSQTGTSLAGSITRMASHTPVSRVSTPRSRSASRGSERASLYGQSPVSPRPARIQEPSPSAHPSLSDPGICGHQSTVCGLTDTCPLSASCRVESRSQTTSTSLRRNPIRHESVHPDTSPEFATSSQAPLDFGHVVQKQYRVQAGRSAPTVFRLDTPASSPVTTSAKGPECGVSPVVRSPRGASSPSHRPAGPASPSCTMSGRSSGGGSCRRPRASSPTFFSNRSSGSTSPASPFAQTSKSAASGSPFTRSAASHGGTPKVGTADASIGASPAAPAGAWTPFRANLFSPGSAVEPTPVPYSPIDAISPFNGSHAVHVKSPRAAPTVLGDRPQSPSALHRNSPSMGTALESLYSASGSPTGTRATGTRLPLLAPLFGVPPVSPQSARGGDSGGGRGSKGQLGSNSPFFQRGSPFFPSPSASPDRADSPLVHRHGDMAPSSRTEPNALVETNLSPTSTGRSLTIASRANILPTSATEACAAAAATAAKIHSAEAVNAANRAHKTGVTATSSAALQVPGSDSHVVSPFFSSPTISGTRHSEPGASPLSRLVACPRPEYGTSPKTPGVVGNQSNALDDNSGVTSLRQQNSCSGTEPSFPAILAASPQAAKLNTKIEHRNAVDMLSPKSSVHSSQILSNPSGAPPTLDALPSLSPVAAAAASALPPETSALVLGHFFPTQLQLNPKNEAARSRSSSPLLTPRAAATAAAARIRAEAAAAAATAAADRAAAAARSSVSPRAVDASRRAADAAAAAVAAARRCASTSPRIAAASERTAAAIAAAAAASAAAAGSAKDINEARRRAVPVAAAAAAVAAARQRAAAAGTASEFLSCFSAITRRGSALSPASGGRESQKLLPAGTAIPQPNKALGRSIFSVAAAAASAAGAAAVRGARGLPFVSPGRTICRKKSGEPSEFSHPATDKTPLPVAADTLTPASPGSRIAAVLRASSPKSPAPPQAPQNRGSSPDENKVRHRPTLTPFFAEQGGRTEDTHYGQDHRGDTNNSALITARGEQGRQLRRSRRSGGTAAHVVMEHDGDRQHAQPSNDSRGPGVEEIRVLKAWTHADTAEVEGRSADRGNVLRDSAALQAALRSPEQRFPVWVLCRELIARRTYRAKTYVLDGVPFDRWRLQVVPTMGASTTSTRCQRMWKGRLPSGRAVFVKKVPSSVWEQQWRLTQRYKGFFLTDGENFVGEAAISAFLTDCGPACAAPLLAVLHEDGNYPEGPSVTRTDSEATETGSTTSRVVLVNQVFGQGDLLDFFDSADPEVFTPASKRSLQYSVTQILVSLHSAGIAHLDLTPENILVHAYTEALPSSMTPQSGFGVGARGSGGSSTTPSAKLSGGSVRRVQLKVCDLAKAAPLFNHSPFRLPPCILKAHFGDSGQETPVSSTAAQPFLSCEPTVAKGPYMPPECWRIVYILRALGITAPFAQVGEPLLTTGRPPPPLYLKDPSQSTAQLFGAVHDPIDVSAGVDAAELFFDVRKADVYMLGVLLFWIWAEGAIWTCSDPRQDAQYNDLLQCGMEFSIFTDCDGWPPELRHLLKGALDPDPTRRVTLPEILQHPWWTCSLAATGQEAALTS
ncbi:putative FIKK kinase [Toxoplasma gondii VAND]|uniref:non-specific serine/threonine protein kinase n=1 Tax=Toxoplasma gondii VAND TaxID=933077 RepID=A0A086Q8F5_TOXGO|nr:putative FIKK kinase [Toxoplasma gondii VAND]